MNTSIRHSLPRLRAWSLAALCVLALSAPCSALAQTANSSDRAKQPSSATQPPPGNSPFSFVDPASAKNSAKRTDNGKNEK